MTTASFQPQSTTITKALRLLDSGLFTFNEQDVLVEYVHRITGVQHYTGDLFGLLMLASCHPDEMATYLDGTNSSFIADIVLDWAQTMLELPEAVIDDYFENYLEPEVNLWKKLTELDPHLASVGY